MFLNQTANNKKKQIKLFNVMLPPFHSRVYNAYIATQQISNKYKYNQYARNNVID